MLFTAVICGAFVVYGICAVIGIQNIKTKYSDQKWAGEYKRAMGIAWIILGVCWFLMSLLLEKLELNGIIEMLLKVSSVIPSVIYLRFIEKKYADRYNSGI